jgi:CxxC motif-containing protein (DUF1111 family)
MSFRIRHVICLAVAWLAAGCGDAPGLTVVKEDPSDLPLSGLSDDERQRFKDGDALFELPFRASMGIGPLYIRSSCAACHADDGRGPGAVTKMAAGEPAVDLPYGHTVRPQMAAGATTAIVAPVGAVTSLRVGPPVFARGYIEAIADSEIARVEREQAAGGVVSGRINRVTYASQANPDTRFNRHQPGDTGLIGRFGLKARIATVDEFAADAFQGDMGLTSPLRPDELPNPDGLTDDQRPGVDVTADDVNVTADYVRTLALPKRAAPDAAGAALFAQVGCATCHVPALRTAADYPIALLADIDAPVYSDVLLHDMGAELADGIADGDASGNEWRTAPLVGMRFFRSFLHDGRAKTLRDAVVAHGGPGSEASAAAAAFQALSTVDQQGLLDFVAGL